MRLRRAMGGDRGMVPREGARADDRPQDGAALPAAGEPGDLGGRVSRRRQHLKLSRRELSGLAGVSVPYLLDLEAHHARPTQAVLRRLAAALQTTPQTLLGASTGLPVLETLTSAECFDLLAPGGVGRVAFTTA